LPLAASVGPSGHVTGVDIAEPMLGLLRRRVAERGIANLTRCWRMRRPMPSHRRASTC